MSEKKIGPRGRRILYSWFFSGGVHKDDHKDIQEFKDNCAMKGIHMSYDGKNRRCGWSILIKRDNRLEKILMPFAQASGIDADVFIDEVLDEFLENIKLECTDNNMAHKLGMLRNDVISKTISNVIKNRS